MKANKLTKAQVQMVVLGGLIAVGVLAGGYQFVLVPIQSASAQAVIRREELSANLVRAQGLIRSEMQHDKQSTDYRASMRNKLMTQLPPTDNALAWASQLVQAHTRKLGLQVNSISEEAGVGGGWEQGDFAKRVFKPYSVRIELACGFENIRGLVRSLQQENPYISLSSATLTAGRQNVQTISVVIILEWPTWRDAKQAKVLQESAANQGPGKQI